MKEPLQIVKRHGLWYDFTARELAALEELDRAEQTEGQRPGPWTREAYEKLERAAKRRAAKPVTR